MHEATTASITGRVPERRGGDVSLTSRRFGRFPCRDKTQQANHLVETRWASNRAPPPTQLPGPTFGPTPQVCASVLASPVDKTQQTNHVVGLDQFYGPHGPRTVALSPHPSKARTPRVAQLMHEDARDNPIGIMGRSKSGELSPQLQIPSPPSSMPRWQNTAGQSSREKNQPLWAVHGPRMHCRYNCGSVLIIPCLTKRHKPMTESSLQKSRSGILNQTLAN